MVVVLWCENIRMAVFSKWQKFSDRYVCSVCMINDTRSTFLFHYVSWSIRMHAWVSLPEILHFLKVGFWSNWTQWLKHKQSQFSAENRIHFNTRRTHPTDGLCLLIHLHNFLFYKLLTKKDWSYRKALWVTSKTAVLVSTSHILIPVVIANK